ncbi:MAG: c-type cytochrome [Methyloceanibacter sp.]
MLRALTIFLVAVGLTFVGWSLLVMTGGRDMLIATMSEDTAADKSAPAALTTPSPAADTNADADAGATKPDHQAEVTDETKVTANETAPAGETKDHGAAPSAAPAAGEAKDENAGAAPAPAGDAAGKGAEAKPEGDAAKPEGDAAKGSGDSAAKAAPGGGASADAGGNPQETTKSAEKGSLKSPYAADYKSVAADGQKVFMAAGCSGCHGGSGGGGMGPPLTNEIWVYGPEDDTLFRLVALGSDELQKQGYSRKGSENVVGPMPPQGTIVKSNDDLWKIIAWIRSINPSSAGG